MSSKWKYANLDAQHRIELLKNGNKELFDEEVARTKEITEARRELGLDTTEQENWMNTVGYNYNLSLAGSGDKVSKTGYAQLYLDGKKPDTQLSSVNINKEAKGASSYISSANSKIDKAQELAKTNLTDKYRIKKQQIRDELYEKYPYIKEQILNEGGSLHGGKLQRAYDSIEKELADIYSGLEAELTQQLAALDKKYAGIKSKVMEYRTNGATLESLGIIADVLINKAANEDGFDISGIPGVGEKKITVKNVRDKAGDESEATNTAKVPQYKKESDSDDEYDEAENSADGINVTEEATAGDAMKNVADYLKKAVSDKTDENTEVIRALGEMFARNGMNPKSAVLTAAELVMLLAKSAAKGA